MVLWGKALDTEFDERSSVPRAYMVDGESRVLKVVL